MEYLTAVEVSKKWNISSRMVAYYCETGRIDGAAKKGKTWFIPAYAEKPVGVGADLDWMTYFPFWEKLSTDEKKYIEQSSPKRTGSGTKRGTNYHR